MTVSSRIRSKSSGAFSRGRLVKRSTPAGRPILGPWLRVLPLDWSSDPGSSAASMVTTGAARVDRRGHGLMRDDACRPFPGLFGGLAAGLAAVLMGCFLLKGGCGPYHGVTHKVFGGCFFGFWFSVLSRGGWPSFFVSLLDIIVYFGKIWSFKMGNIDRLGGMPGAVDAKVVPGHTNRTGTASRKCAVVTRVPIVRREPCCAVHGSLHASRISERQELSSYPATCTLQRERRTLARSAIHRSTASRRRAETDTGVSVTFHRRRRLPHNSGDWNHLAPALGSRRIR